MRRISLLHNAEIGAARSKPSSVIPLKELGGNDSLVKPYAPVWTPPRSAAPFRGSGATRRRGRRSRTRYRREKKGRNADYSFLWQLLYTENPSVTYGDSSPFRGAKAKRRISPTRKKTPPDDNQAEFFQNSEFIIKLIAYILLQAELWLLAGEKARYCGDMLKQNDKPRKQRKLHNESILNNEK